MEWLWRETKVERRPLDLSGDLDEVLLAYVLAASPQSLRLMFASSGCLPVCGISWVLDSIVENVHFQFKVAGIL